MLKPSGLNDCIICKRGAVVGYLKAPKENFLLRPEFHLFWTVHNCMSLRKLASREGHTVFLFLVLQSFTLLFCIVEY